MSDVVNFGSPLDRPNASKSIKAFSSDRPGLTQGTSESIDYFKSTVTDGVEVILSAAQSQGSDLTYENLKPKS
tara:strand:- start:108 stop:326 length:219 start_codon:yes stop_codon:yes gene_type:complete